MINTIVQLIIDMMGLKDESSKEDHKNQLSNIKLNIIKIIR